MTYGLEGRCSIQLSYGQFSSKTRYRGIGLLAAGYYPYYRAVSTSHLHYRSSVSAVEARRVLCCISYDKLLFFIHAQYTNAKLKHYQRASLSTSRRYSHYPQPSCISMWIKCRKHRDKSISP